MQNSTLNHTIKISKSIGDKFLESEEKCLKLVNEHPKVVVFLGAVVTVVVANLANCKKDNNLDVKKIIQQLIHLFLKYLKIKL